MKLLKGEVIIITGSTKGIGRSTAHALAREGAAVVINGRKEEDVQNVVQSIVEEGGEAVGVAGCVANEETGEKLVEIAVHSFGKVTGLINNAGIIRDKISHRMDLKDFSDVIDVHVKGTFICSKPVIQQMKSNEIPGFILNMTSLAGLIGTVGQINYSAAKAAILGMTWTLSKELAADSIQVNAIAPAALTEMTQPAIENAMKQAEENGQDLSEYWSIGSAEDVAVFLVEFIKHRNIKETGEVYSINKNEVGRWLPPSYELL